MCSSTSFGTVFERERSRFNTLFKRRAMAHHYTEYIDISDIAHAEEVVANICNDYDVLNTKHVLPHIDSSKNAHQTPSKVRFPVF